MSTTNPPPPEGGTPDLMSDEYGLGKRVRESPLLDEETEIDLVKGETPSADRVYLVRAKEGTRFALVPKGDLTRDALRALNREWQRWALGATTDPLVIDPSKFTLYEFPPGATDFAPVLGRMLTDEPDARFSDVAIRWGAFPSPADCAFALSDIAALRALIAKRFDPSPSDLERPGRYAGELLADMAEAIERERSGAAEVLRQERRARMRRIGLWTLATFGGLAVAAGLVALGMALG